MKKYIVLSQIGSHHWDTTIECDYMEYSSTGVYYFHNSETGEEWWFPVARTVIKKIVNK